MPVLMTFIIGDNRTRVHNVDEARDMIDKFVEYGYMDVNTARIYSNGPSEQYLSKVHLTSVNLDTKLFPSAANPKMASPMQSYHHSAKDLPQVLMDSLEALEVTIVHIWYLHSSDRTVLFEETLQEGYFEKLGISNYQSWEVAKICDICDKNGGIKRSVC
jgi:aflatoxin B1 aldehyde reductase